MKKYFMYAVLFLTASAGFLACNSGQNPLSLISPLSIDPPFTNMAIGCNADVIQNEKGGEILYESGSKIIVPPNAFVDKAGNPVKGDVKINYREFHSNAEIMTSGIPMNFKKDGKYENFQSAGMFELTVDHGGEAVQLASGKSITCETVTTELDEDYDFYYYDEELQEWEEIEGEDPSVNKDEDELPSAVKQIELVESQLDIVKPEKPQKADMDLPVFEIGTPQSEKKVGEKKVKAIGTVSKSVLWQFAPGYDLEKEAMDKVLSGSNWSNYSLEQEAGKGQVYRLDLGTDKTAPVYITPVLFGKDYRSAMVKYQKELKAFNKQAKLVSDQNAFKEKTRDFWRTASVARLGVHNWDRLMKRKDAILLNASFELEGGADLPEKAQVFMLTGKKKEIITFYPTMFANFAFDPKVENTLLAILPGEKIGVFTKEAFGKLNKGSLRRSGQHKFTLKSVVANIAGVEDLQKFIDSL
jgi:hypothetical protein